MRSARVQGSSARSGRQSQEAEAAFGSSCGAGAALRAHATSTTNGRRTSFQYPRHAANPALTARNVAHAPANGLGHAVVATDGSEHARHAVAFAARLPLPAETELAVVHVARPFHPSPLIAPWHPLSSREAIDYVHERRLERGRHLVEDARARLESAGRPVAAVVREGDPATEILALAEERGADLIGSRSLVL